VLLVLFSVSGMCWACTGYSAHGVQIFGCYYTSHFEQEMLSSTLMPQKQL